MTLSRFDSCQKFNVGVTCWGYTLFQIVLAKWGWLIFHYYSLSFMQELRQLLVQWPLSLCATGCKNHLLFLILWCQFKYPVMSCFFVCIFHFTCHTCNDEQESSISLSVYLFCILGDYVCSIFCMTKNLFKAPVKAPVLKHIHECVFFTLYHGSKYKEHSRTVYVGGKNIF